MKRVALIAALFYACGTTSNGNNDGMTGMTGATDGTGATTGPTGPSAATDDMPDPPEPDTISTNIGPAGGKITLGTLQASIPKGALDGTATITISRTIGASVEGYNLFSPLFHFDPADLALASPFIVVIPFANASADALLFWSSASDPNVFEAVPGQIVGDTYVAVVDRMGMGFVGELKPVVVDITPPSAPIGVVAHGGDTEVDVTWPAVAGATVYQVEYSAIQGGPYSPLGTTNTLKFTHTGLQNNALAYYVVRARNAAGDSDESAEASTTTGEIEAPTLVEAVPGNTEITVQWNASAFSSTHSKYNLYRTTPSAPTPVVIATTTTLSFKDTGRENGRRYSYIVRGVDAGNLESSDSVAVETFSYALPTMLTGAQAVSAADCDYTFSWAAPTDGADTYRVGALFPGGDFSEPINSVPSAAHSFSCVMEHIRGRQNLLTYSLRVCYTDPDGQPEENCSPFESPVSASVTILDDAMTDGCQPAEAADPQPIVDSYNNCRAP